MEDTDKPQADPILQQIPLIKNPSYQPPRAITLNNNYNKLIPTLKTSVIPPKLNLKDDDLKNWITSIEELRAKHDPMREQPDIEAFESWCGLQQRKFAPGFKVDEIMTPSQRKSETPVQEQRKDDNDIDKLFGKVSLS